MTWILTAQGRDHHLCDDQSTHHSNAPSLREIAHSLAHINRFTGHASRAYSVAEHSLLVMQIAEKEFGADEGGQLAALMHDAHECITGDVASPIKQVLGEVWHKFEAMHENALRTHYGLQSLYQKHAAMVKQCDLIALATERRDLMHFDASKNTPWPILDTLGKVVPPWAYVKLNTGYRATKSPKSWAVDFERQACCLLEIPIALQ